MAYNGSTDHHPDYTAEEAVVVDKAKRIHKETTASAERALKTAQQTRELAANTLEELHKQGDQLDAVDKDLSQIDMDVQESKNLLSYMRRCCLCFVCSCCCECDADKGLENNRKQRLKMRHEMVAHEKAASAQAHAQVSQPGGPQPVQNGAALDAARNELLGNEDAPAGRRQSKQRQSALQIGESLAEPDRNEVQAETAKQEEALDSIGDALSDLKRMGKAMNDELGRQEDQLDRLQGHTEKTNSEIMNVSKTAKKDFKLKSKAVTPGASARSVALKMASRLA